MSYKHKVEGKWLGLNGQMQGAVQYIMGHYYIKDGKENNDGSIGSIKITPKEFMDMVASFIPPDVGEEEEVIDVESEEVNV